MQDPLRPLLHLPAQEPISVRSAVVTVADPTETHLGRIFDVGLAAIISGFQSQNYVLDGYALDWQPSESATTADKPTPGTQSFDKNHRQNPGLLVFRDDDWRKTDCESCHTRYFLLFLVGEAPSFGVHPAAFAVAARCALALQLKPGTPPGVDVAGPDAKRCDTLPPHALTSSVGEAAMLHLEVIGPLFSGSLESLAVATRTLAETVNVVPKHATQHSDAVGAAPVLRVHFVSPSASVDSNTNIARHPYLPSHSTVPNAPFLIEYETLAVSLDKQIKTLLGYLCDVRRMEDPRIVVFTEESSFGSGASESVRAIEGPSCKPKFTAARFPPNIASIRAEHARLRAPQAAEKRQLLPAFNGRVPRGCG